MTKGVVESRTMVYVIEGDIILVSRAVLETLGCIPKSFPKVGEFLENDDEAITGKAFAVNPSPTGWSSDGKYYPEKDADRIVNPGPKLPTLVRPVWLAWWVG